MRYRLIVDFSILCAVLCATPIRADELPISGKTNSAYAVADRVMTQFMQEHDISAGVIAIRWKNQLVCERAYGWSDQARTKKLEPNALFRIAGLSKPITAATARQLIQQHKLKGETKVVEFLGLKPREGDTPDPRIFTVTIEQLIMNEGGWDRDVYDPHGHESDIAKEMELDHQPTPMEIAMYMMGQPLQYAPGTRKNVPTEIGYVLLGLAIEKAAGTTYGECAQQRLFGPLTIRDAIPARSLLKDCSPKEVWYSDAETTVSVVEPDNLDPVPWCYGGFVLENRFPTNGWVMSAASYAKFMESFDIYGKRLAGGHWGYVGSLPGAFSVAVWQKDGLKVVALFNQSKDASAKEYYAFRQILEGMADAIVLNLSGDHGKPAAPGSGKHPPGK